MLEVEPAVRSEYDRDVSIADAFARRAALTPSALAVLDERASISFAELDRRSNQLANLLIARGIVPGSTVGVAFERSIELSATLLGIVKAGAAYVPLDMAYPRERFAFMVADSAMTFVVTKQPICDPALFEGVDVVSVVDDAALLDAQSVERPEVPFDAGGLAYITYTSGSTGRPKGVAVTHRGVVRLVCGTDYVDISERDRYLHFAPLAFDASTFEIWAPLLNGASLAIPREGLLSIAEIGETIERFGVSTMFLTTSLFRRLVESELPTFGGLRHLLTGGEVASPVHMRRFLELYPGCRLSAVYGPTENTTFSTWCDLPNRAAIGDNVPIGRPVANSTAYVLDERMEPVATGTEGELCVGGDGVARGYVNLDVLTAERFARDPFASDPSARLYRTGDRARLRADGLLEFLGRTDDQVKIGGHRIELGEIENALLAYPNHSDAAVVVSELAGEKALFAFVVPAAGATFEAQRVREHLATKLPHFMMPSRIAALERLPEHASGKRDRVALARLAASLCATDRAAQPSLEGASPALGRVAMQRRVAGCWQGVLGVEVVADVDQNFFDSGGDSLRLLTLHDRLQREFGIEFAIVELFEHCTVRKLTAFVRARLPQTPISVH